MAADPAGAATRVRRELADQRLPASMARIYGQHVRLRNGQPPLTSFSGAEMEQRLNDAIRLIEASLAPGADGADREAGLRRAGEILEWLAHSPINEDGLPLSLLGAAAYQLAGYPARAYSLIEGQPEVEGPSPLLEALLQADFNRLLQLGAAIAVTPPRSVESRVAAGESDTEARTAHLTERLVGEMASALGVLAASFRWPDESRAEVALEKLDAMPSALRHLVDPFSWLLVRLSVEMARGSRERSLRTGLLPITANASEDGRLVLERYARLGFQARQALVWPSQQRGFERLATQGSFALCTPTGSGKTRVAEVALLDGLFRPSPTDLGAPLCLYIVPSRALATEVEAKLSRVLRDAGGPRAVTVTSLYGGADWGATEEWLSGDEPTVLICTQEKAEALVRFFGWILLGRLSVVILDEAHSIQFDGGTEQLARFESRSLRLESLVASLRARRPDARYIAMSAVAREIEEPLGQWISGEGATDAVTVDYRSTRQVIGRLHFFNGGDTRIEYDVLDGYPLALSRDTGEHPYVWQPFPRRPDTEGLDGVQQAPATFALWAAINLASAASDRDEQTVLVSIAEGIGNYGLWWLDLLESQWADEEVPTFFEGPQGDEDRELWRRTLAMSRDLFGAESREYRLLEHGVVVHHGRMPGRLPGLLTRLIERGIARIVLATSVLSEGVNLPVQTVLLPGMYRHSVGRPMSNGEFGNLAGRAGRPGVATEGQTLVLMPGGTGLRSPQRRDYDRAIRALTGDVEARTEARSALGELLLTLRQWWDGYAEEEFLAWLEETAPQDFAIDDGATQALDAVDAVLLAALEGEDATAVESVLRTFWRQTFAAHAEAEEQRLEEIFVKRGRAVAGQIYPTAAERTTLYRTSLPPREATALLDLMPRLMAHLRTGTNYVRWGEAQRLDYVTTAMDLVSEVPKFTVPDRIGPKRATSHDVLTWWLRTPGHDVAPTVPQISAWHSFLQQEVRYRFTWGLGAALAVAVQQAPTEGLSAGDWQAAGVPWAAVWIKDLLTWGVLDPVAAYLLSRGIVDTRDEARAAAEEYFSTAAPPTQDPLDVNQIRAWAAQQWPRSSTREPRPDRRTRVRVSERIRGDDLQKPWRVVPVRYEGSIRWTDPAGFELARSVEERRRPMTRTDFTLHPAERVVIARPYV